MKDIFVRSKLNPILKPKKNGWWKVYNPGACIDERGYIHIFPRVMKKEKNWHSRIAHAVSKEGERFAWSKQLAIQKDSKNTKEFRGVEDPRVTRIGEYYHMTFAVFDGKDVLLHSAKTKNLNGKWHREGKMVPDFHFFRDGGAKVRFREGKAVIKKDLKDKRHWSKSGALFPEKINGEYVLMFGEFKLWLARSKNGKKFIVDKKPFLHSRTGTKYFDNAFVEAGPPPILTEKGWLVLYHGVDEAFRYRIGFLLLDKRNPRKILFRSPEPIFWPKEKYEVGDALVDVIPGGIEAMRKLSDKELKSFYIKVRKENIMPQVTFCPGAVVKNDFLYIYYGAGDTSVCVAKAKISDILSLVK